MTIYTGSDQSELALGEDGYDIFDMFGGIDTVRGALTFDLINGGDGLDFLYGGEGDDSIYGGAGRDRIYGDDGNDRLFGGLGHDLMYGGAGDDLLMGGGREDRLIGGEGRDRLFGGTGRDTLTGQGDDTLFGGADADFLWISATLSDTIFGGDGDDRFHLSSTAVTGASRVFGGAGMDILQFQNSPLTFSAATFPSSAGGLVFAGIEAFALNHLGRADVDWRTRWGNDQLRSGDGDDLILAGGGRDDIFSASGHDTVRGGDGDDRIAANGGSDLIYGGQGHDTIEAGLSTDWDGAGSTAFGDDGDDRMESLSSLQDTLTGGAGADTFVMRGFSDTPDIVTDFTVGIDRIGFRLQLDVISGSDPQATDGNAVFLFDTDTGLLSLDVNGSGARGQTAYFILQGVTSLTADDFVLVP